MAVRPLVTTGVALISAGALVAGTPALFVPRDEVAVAASSVEAPVQRTMTAEQMNLVALTLQGAWQSFTQGYGARAIPGGVPAPAPGLISDGSNPPIKPPVGTPADTVLVDANGTPLYRYDADGKLVRATVGNLGEGVQFYNTTGAPVYILDKGAPVLFEDRGNCSATGAVCKDGFVGLAYYVSDNLLPFGELDNVFYEAGLVPFFQVAAEVVAAVVPDPAGRLDLVKRVDEFFAGGVALVVGSILNDNLPDGGFAQNLSNSFFFGYGANTGITAAVTYVIDALTQQTPNPVPGGESEADSARLSLLSAEGKAEGTTTGTEPGSAASTTLPNVSTLLSLPTNVESPFKGFPKLELKSPSATLVSDLTPKGQATVEKTVEVADTTTPAPEVSVPEVKPEAPKFELPKLPKPDLELTPTTTVKEAKETKEAASQEESDDKTGKNESTDTSSAAASTKTPNKFAPKPGERKPSAGEKFVKQATENLQKAFKPTTKAGASKHESANSGADTGATAGNSTHDSKGNSDGGSDKDK